MVKEIGARIRLNDGNAIPCFGFGCYNGFGPEMVRAVRTALESGYRYLDSAAMYRNEKEVGEGLKESGIAREECFLLSKVWPTDFQDVEAALLRSLRDLKTEYLDAFLLHWPGQDESVRLRAYEQALRAQEKGLFRTLGVSNFYQNHLEEIRRAFGSFPAVNELELHPYFQQRELSEFHRRSGIALVAYSPLARGECLNEPALQALSERYGKSSGQIVLRWQLQKGQIPIPKSIRPERIGENGDVFGFRLTEEEMAAVDALERGGRLGNHPDRFPV
ncbi:MAG: aldo/keto reductase [Lawsonibacter sp.]|nr:aldo/keto reductase [Lawsonibacter sp.]